jgi:hypothetical protein
MAMCLLFSVVGAVSTESVACMAAGRFRAGLGSLDGRTLAQKKQEYDRIERRSPFHVGLRSIVDRPLRRRLEAVAQAVIADYRQEEPTVGPVEWRQASEALDWRLEMRPRTDALEAKQLLCEAHMARFAAQSQPRGAAQRQAYQAVVDRFEDAARLDDRSFDPWLGIARTQIYGLNDVDAGAAAIAEATKRGYQVTRRESAELGDGYLWRAERSRRRARALSGDARREELESARADYQRCVDEFTPIVGFGQAAINLDVCKRHVDELTEALAPAGESDSPDLVPASRLPLLPELLAPTPIAPGLVAPKLSRPDR